MHHCPPLMFDFNIPEHKLLAEKNGDGPYVPGIGKRPAMELCLYNWVQANVKNTLDNVLKPLAARDIQKIFRRFPAIRRLNTRRMYLLYIESIVKIQRAYRGHFDRAVARCGVTNGALARRAPCSPPFRFSRGRREQSSSGHFPVWQPWHAAAKPP